MCRNTYLSRLLVNCSCNMHFVSGSVCQSSCLTDVLSCCSLPQRPEMFLFSRKAWSPFTENQKICLKKQNNKFCFTQHCARSALDPSLHRHFLGSLLSLFSRIIKPRGLIWLPIFHFTIPKCVFISRSNLQLYKSSSKEDESVTPDCLSLNLIALEKFCLTVKQEFEANARH